MECTLCGDECESVVSYSSSRATFTVKFEELLRDRYAGE